MAFVSSMMLELAESMAFVLSMMLELADHTTIFDY